MRTTRSSLALFFSLVLLLNAAFAQKPKPYDILNNFVPSGYMGDIKNIIIAKNTKDIDRPDSICTKISYKSGDSGWGGVYWQYPANNWCQRKGKDLSRFGYSEVTFWVRGQKGDEEVKFRIGHDCGDSFVSDEITHRLTTKWTRMSIPIDGKALTNITGAFCWVVDSKANESTVVLYIDDVQFE